MSCGILSVFFGLEVHQANQFNDLACNPGEKMVKISLPLRFYDRFTKLPIPSLATRGPQRPESQRH